MGMEERLIFWKEAEYHNTSSWKFVFSKFFSKIKAETSVVCDLINSKICQSSVRRRLLPYQSTELRLEGTTSVNISTLILLMNIFLPFASFPEVNSFWELGNAIPFSSFKILGVRVYCSVWSYRKIQILIRVSLSTEFFSKRRKNYTFWRETRAEDWKRGWNPISTGKTGRYGFSILIFRTIEIASSGRNDSFSQVFCFWLALIGQINK